MIVAIILMVWTLCGVIAYVCLGLIDPREVEGNEIEAIVVCFVAWYLLLLIGIGYLIFSALSKVGDWTRGFVMGLMKKEGEKE